MKSDPHTNPHRTQPPDERLRTRITAAIAKADEGWCHGTQLHEDMADAVIRELGLKRVNRYQHHRHVTEWTADEVQ